MTLTAPAPHTGLRTPVTPVNPTDVYVDGEKLYGVKAWVYRVWVDGTVYDEFTSRTPLSWAQQDDVAGMYLDALTVSTTTAAA